MFHVACSCLLLYLSAIISSIEGPHIFPSPKLVYSDTLINPLILITFERYHNEKAQNNQLSYE